MESGTSAILLYARKKTREQKVHFRLLSKWCERSWRHVKTVTVGRRTEFAE